jgi:hexulose-6-phosphate isomerase
MMHHIGFMQGRLCDKVDNKIQAFPWSDWEIEFPAAAQIDLHLMEWTLDQERLHENPLMTTDGRKRILMLCKKHGISIPSLTGDCFMQAPFWKADGKLLADLQRDFLNICLACSETGIHFIVLPLVDNGRLETAEQENKLVDILRQHRDFLSDHKLKVVFESDFAPHELARFIARLPTDQFGINYDIGNSAALGFNPDMEFSAYGERVVNVHIKDRSLGGPSVPLKTGRANFDAVFSALARQSYEGNFILQTARAIDNNHQEVLVAYRDMTRNWIRKYGLFEMN